MASLFSPCRLFGHWWQDSRVNRYFIATEQTCRLCGQQRYHLMEDQRGFDSPAWRVGQHPNSAPSEREGREES